MATGQDGVCEPHYDIAAGLGESKSMVKLTKSSRINNKNYDLFHYLFRMKNYLLI